MLLRSFEHQSIADDAADKADFERVYEDLRTGKNVEPNRTVFLLSILASVAALWAFSPDEIPLYSNRQQALDAAYDWTRITLDVLEQVRRSGSATLETIQATISVVFLLYHADGFSLKVRALHGSAISIAKELGLHRTDAARNGLPQPKNQAEIVDRELRRRIWWHLACTDWSLGTAGSMHAGTYLISPRQMRVQKPRNLSDDELSTMPSDWERPISVPTIMSYSIIRIRLGEISRRIADLDSMLEMDHISIDEIISVDDEFETLLTDLPVFLRIDQQSLWKTSHLETEHPHLPLQRYIVSVYPHCNWRCTNAPVSHRSISCCKPGDANSTVRFSSAQPLTKVTHRSASNASAQQEPSSRLATTYPLEATSSGSQTQNSAVSSTSTSTQSSCSSSISASIEAPETKRPGGRRLRRHARRWKRPDINLCQLVCSLIRS